MIERRSTRVDFANIWSDPADGHILRTVGWGTRVEVLDPAERPVPVQSRRFIEQEDGSVTWETVHGFIRLGSRTFDKVFGPAESDVLRVDFIDVQQGDAAVVETPGNKVMLIDGGDNQLFARYLASRFRGEKIGTSTEDPLDVAAIVVTHGDADHFAGLSAIQDSETYASSVKKRLFIRPHLVVHNGLVKHPDGVPEQESLGRTVEADGERYIVELVDDLIEADPDSMNGSFREWREALAVYRQRDPGVLEVRRLARGMDSPFGDLETHDLRFEVLGPETVTVADGATEKPGLRLLHSPKTTATLEDLEPSGSVSASHTINGHSIVLRLRYRNVRILFTGDLTAEAAAHLATSEDAAGEPEARCEVFKVPHHGSADYSTRFMKAVSPIVSVISSGDENAGKDYIHPRANLVGSLGRFSRVERPAVFCTELSAFFGVKGWVDPKYQVLTEAGLAAIKRKRPKVVDPRTGPFYAFVREAWGAVHLRTDGKRLLVWADGAKQGLMEPYAFTVAADGKVEASGIVKI